MLDPVTDIDIHILECMITPFEKIGRTSTPEFASHCEGFRRRNNSVFGGRWVLSMRITRQSATAREPAGIGEYSVVIIIWAYIVYYIISRSENSMSR
jgi:hypothetical protein